MVDTAAGNSSQNFCLRLAVAHTAGGGVAAEHKKTARRRSLCAALMSDEAASLIVRLLGCGDVAPR